jgi:acyl-coenzyme A synthetase/AMP-(fatty) acid ligase
VIGAKSISLTAWDLSADNGLSRGCDVLLTGQQPAHHVRVPMLVMTGDWLGEAAVQAVAPAYLALIERDIPGDRIARIYRSSGTTGTPKPVAMTHITQQLIVARFAAAIGDDLLPRPSYLCLYNMTLQSAYYRVLGALQHGGLVHFAGPSEAPGLVESGAVNTAMFITGDLHRLVQSMRPPPIGHALHIEAVGAAVSPLLRQQIGQRLNAKFANYYSSSETGRMAQIGADDVGTVVPGVEIRIVDEHGRDRPLGETGLIRARTETMVDGYYNDPAQTEANFVDGWFRTSDLGTMPAPGRLIILGRADDMLNIGGVKILPAPIEARIKLIDGIVDAVLVSVDGPGQIATLLAAVETANGKSPPGLKEQLDPILFPYVRIFAVLIMHRFPRTDSGKVRRNDVATIYAQVRASPDRVIRGGTIVP